MQSKSATSSKLAQSSSTVARSSATATSALSVASSTATSTASTTVSAYAMSDSLTPGQTFDTLSVAIVLAIVGVLLVEERLLAYLAGAPGRISRERSSDSSIIRTTT